MSALPSITRLKRGGKEVGNYGCTVRGKRVNLQTQDYELARARARLAMQGLPFDGVVKDASIGPRSFTSSDDWTADLQDAAGSAPAALPPIETENETANESAEPDGYIPPKKEEPASEEPAQTTTLPPEFMDGILDQASLLLVELQIMGQEWMAKRWAKVQMGEVPHSGDAAVGRKAGAEVWKQALKELVPTDVPLPPYLLAPVVVAALTVPVQLAGASKWEPEPPRK